MELSGPLVRPASGDVRDHIDPRKSDHFVAVIQRLSAAEIAKD
jgi:hypothetical protein